MAGVPIAQRDTDYLATRTYSGSEVDIAWLEVARSQLKDSYGDVQALPV